MKGKQNTTKEKGKKKSCLTVSTQKNQEERNNLLNSPCKTPSLVVHHTTFKKRKEKEKKIPILSSPSGPVCMCAVVARRPQKLDCSSHQDTKKVMDVWGGPVIGWLGWKETSIRCLFFFF